MVGRESDIARRFTALLERQDTLPPSDERLSAALHRLEELLTQQGNPVVRGLRPGVSEPEVRARMSALSLAALPELISWFGWHNGCEPQLDKQGRRWLELAPGFPFVDLDSLERRYVDFDLRFGTAPGWFPIMMTGGASTLVMDCGLDSNTLGRIALKNELGEVEPTRGVSTLAVPLEWWCEALDSGIWVFDLLGFHPTLSNEQALALPDRLLRSGLF